MGHCPESWAAGYLDGMSARDRAGFEEHLLACETCWREVSLARAGRALAESVRERAPAGLRESIRAGVAVAATGTRPRTGGLAGVLATVAVVLVLIGGVSVWRPWVHPEPAVAAPTSAVAQAVRGFRQDRLPGTSVPAQRAPDLTGLGLRLVGAAAGTIEGTPVTAFAYGGATGRLDVYRSARPIPEADEAHVLDGDEDAWRTNVEGITVICGPASHTMLLIGADPALVDRAGRLLDLV
jgi:hypothetical protein